MADGTLFIPSSDEDEALATSTTSASAGAAPFGTVGVRLEARTAGAHVSFSGAAATTDNLFLPATGIEYFGASPGLVLNARTDTGTGVLGISWLRNR